MSLHDIFAYHSDVLRPFFESTPLYVTELPRKIGRDMEGVQTYLQAFLKKDSDQSSLSSYKIKLGNGTGNSRGERYWADARFQFILTWGERPISLISFDIIDFGLILVKQIQGVKGQKERLRTLKWERALLTLVYKWASESGFNRVIVQPAYKNTHYHPGDPLFEALHIRYDVTPRRCGFRRLEEGQYVGYYYKDI